MNNTKQQSALLIALGLVTITAVITITVVSFTRGTALNSSPFSQSSSTTLTTVNTSSIDPEVTTQEIITGLNNPWDLAFVDDQIFIYSQRGGEIRGYDLNISEGWNVTFTNNVYARGEGGLTGLLADIDFTNNRFVYTCMNVVGGTTITVTRWQLSSDFRSLSNQNDIITDIPANPSGRHSGCRMTMDSQGYLWIGTGDTATDGTIPQDPKSLGGKVLRVDREGNGLAGNMEAPFDSRIFSYGHRNVQGITLFDEPINDIYGYTSEHGTGRDDEINLLRKGNFGWDPIPGYNESRDMTDLTKFPEAIAAIWKSGDPTIAISGMTIIRGTDWGSWNGALLTAVQKDQHIRLHKFDDDFTATRDEKLFEDFGRIRTVVQGPSGHLYLLTDNGRGQDKIIQVSLV